MNSGNPRKKHSISSQTTRNEVLCMLMGKQRSPPFPLSFFLNLLVLPEASLSLKMAMLGQQQYCQSCSGYPKSAGKFFTLARGSCISHSVGVSGGFLSFFFLLFSPFFILRTAFTTQTALRTKILRVNPDSEPENSYPRKAWLQVQTNLVIALLCKCHFPYGFQLPSVIYL